MTEIKIAIYESTPRIGTSHDQRVWQQSADVQNYDFGRLRISRPKLETEGTDLRIDAPQVRSCPFMCMISYVQIFVRFLQKKQNGKLGKKLHRIDTLRLTGTWYILICVLCSAYAATALSYT